MEKFKEGYTGKNFVVEEPKLDFKKPVFKKKLDLPRASEVPVAKEYLEKRKLDPTKFYFAHKFKKWVNTKKQTFDTIGRDESRIIIPMYDTERNLIGFQGRSLGPNSVKYITVMLHEEAPKVYGMDTIDTEKSVYVVEGPFDSTFVNNSIALCGSDGDLEHFKTCDFIYVYDNEPRNKEIVNRIERCVRDNRRVVLWPNNIKEKDINDMIIAGYDIMPLLESNTYSGLEAQVHFNNWKKV
jgi:GTPase SAR1 family protein